MTSTAEKQMILLRSYVSLAESFFSFLDSLGEIPSVTLSSNDSFRFFSERLSSILIELGSNPLEKEILPFIHGQTHLPVTETHFSCYRPFLVDSFLEFETNIRDNSCWVASCFFYRNHRIGFLFSIREGSLQWKI